MYIIIEEIEEQREKDLRTGEMVTKYYPIRRVVADKTKRYYNEMWDWNLEDIQRWYGVSRKEYKEFYKKEKTNGSIE